MARATELKTSVGRRRRRAEEHPARPGSLRFHLGLVWMSTSQPDEAVAVAALSFYQAMVFDYRCGDEVKLPCWMLLLQRQPLWRPEEGSTLVNQGACDGIGQGIPRFWTDFNGVGAISGQPHLEGTVGRERWGLCLMSLGLSTCLLIANDWHAEPSRRAMCQANKHRN